LFGVLIADGERHMIPLPTTTGCFWACRGS
jgi:hypothetical protein